MWTLISFADIQIGDVIHDPRLDALGIEGVVIGYNFWKTGFEVYHPFRPLTIIPRQTDGMVIAKRGMLTAQECTYLEERAVNDLHTAWRDSEIAGGDYLTATVQRNDYLY